MVASARPRMTARADALGLPLQITRLALFSTGAILALTPLATPALALAAGIACSLVVGNPWSRLTGNMSSGLLKIAIIALGFGIPLDRLVSAGATGFVYTLVLTVAAIALGLQLGRWMNIERHLTILITAGTSICGGSAIAAVGPAIGATREAMSVSLATVFVFNAIALYVFPPIGHLVGLSEHQFGIWAALAIHDTSSVVGAAASYGPLALHEATVLKLARALWILPLALLAPLAVRAKKDTLGSGQLPVPWFIALFVLAAIIRSLAPTTAGHWFDSAARAGRTALVLTLFLIGTSVTRDQLRSVGVRPLVYGFLLWLAVAVPTLLAILWGVGR
jgi:uncharacterized integral membrane protein (TIGR00698 family)